jgi:hypothetical protein
MPTNGETVYKTYAELQADKWAEIVARVHAEADADYDNEIARQKAKAKADADLIKTLEAQTAKSRAATARIQPGDLTEARRAYQSSMKEQSVTQGREADARGANAARLLKAKDMALKELRANATVVAASGTAAGTIGRDPVILSQNDDGAQAKVIADQMDALGITSKLRAGSSLAQQDQAVTFRDQLINSGIKPGVANDALAMKGWDADTLTRENVAQQYAAEADLIEQKAYGGGIGAIKKTADEQVALSTATKARVDAIEKSVLEAKAYVLTPEYRRLSAMTEDELMADAGAEAFMKHRGTILSNMDLFRSELNDPAISGATSKRVEEVRAQMQSEEAAAPRRATQMDILREANKQYEPIYGKGGIRQSLRDTVAPVIPSVGPGNYADKVAAQNASVFALNWKDAQALAKKGITIDPADRNVGYMLFDTSKGTLTPQQLVAKAKEAAGDDPEKLNTIVLNYMKKKLAKDQTAQAAIKSPESRTPTPPPTPNEMMGGQTENEKARARGPIAPVAEAPVSEETMDDIAAGVDDKPLAPMTKRDKLKLFLLKARDKGNSRTIKTLDQYGPL